MEDALARVQQYLELALQMHKAAGRETDESRRAALLDLAEQYEKLAEKIFKAQQDNAAAGKPALDPAPTTTEISN